MSTEVEMSIADALAENAALRAQLLLAQADAEALRAGVLAYFVLPHAISDHRLRVQLIELARAEHPGQALLEQHATEHATWLRANTELATLNSDLAVELDAARAVVDAARAALDAPLFEHRAPLVKAIADYDWAVQKARPASC